ncbi:MAG: PKD domain-containing protein [Filimonas sp.]|nr:PKD domain-containing protein [Filimonas sp.]
MHTLKTLLSKYNLLFCVALIFSVVAHAAPVVDFKIKDNGPSGGCSPFLPSFVNTTTGASAGATYKWDFGNGNTPVTKGKDEIVTASYTTPKKYTVTLTVTDGGQAYSKTMEVTVYQKPTADFTVSNPKGCTPLSTTFTSTATPGDGTISKYFWDFGDGTTNNSGTLSNTTHTYTATQQYDVVLTVTNSYGCGITVSKPAAVEGVGAVASVFAANKTVLCDLSEAAVFSNNSTGPGTLTYTWDFGDGTTSTDKTPSHVYTQKGTYTIKLTTSSSEGCTNTATQTNYINAQNFTSAINMPAVICLNTTANFTAQNTPAATSSEWYFNNMPYTTGTSISRYFNVTGDYTVKLVNTFGTCKNTVEKTFTVSPNPALNGFEVDNTALCGAPASVKFRDTSSAAVKWSWQTYTYGTPFATTKEATYNFTSDGVYTIILTITDAIGCTATTSKGIDMRKPNVSVYVKNSNGIYSSTGCEGLKLTFTTSDPANIATYKWDFKDGTTSTEAEPVHVFANAGSYYISLSYVTKNGCTGNIAFAVPVDVYKKPKADFYAASTNICGNTPVNFINTTVGSYTSTTWNFGDGSSSYYYVSNVGHQYNNEGTYSVTMVASNNGCSDTITKTNYIKVVPPFPKISAQQYTCSGTRGDVIFSNGSRQATGWSWTFGDGSPAETYTTNVSTVKHTFTKTGAYKVVLTTTNGQCSVSDSVTAYVLIKQNPVLSADQTTVCTSGSLKVYVRNLETNPSPYYGSISNYWLSAWQKKDLTPLGGGTYSDTYPWTKDYDATLTSLTSGDKEFRAIISTTIGGSNTTNYITCYDTTNYITVKVKGPTAAIKIISNNVCYQSPVVYGDNSTLGEGVPIKKWEWSFGDYPYTPLVTTTGDPVSHNYPTPGSYYPTLKVTDADGCFSTTSSSIYAQVLGPKADFYWSPSSVYPNTTAYFYNNTSGSGSIAYLWSFSASKYTTATYSNISRSYTAALVDTVKLVAYNAATGCKDSITKLVPVKTVSVAFSFTTQYVNNNTCPPVAAYFKTTVSNVNSVKWLFGDGSNAGNNYSPSHTYNKPGVYKITLIGYGANNLTDTAYDYITIKGPYATLSADVMKGCSPVSVNLTAEAKNTVSYMWDYGDGVIEETTGPASAHKYTAPGMYRPALIMKDDTGCASSFELADPILIDSLSAVIKMNTHTLCSSGKLLVDMNTFSIAAANVPDALTQHWDFGTGVLKDTANTATASFQYTATGKYIINLTMQSVAGCSFAAKDSIEVNPVAKGVITGPAEVCEGMPVSYAGSADIIKDVTWQWDFGNGKSDNRQTPAAVTFNGSSTPYQVKLITAYKSCYDTTVKALDVHFKPVVNLLPKMPVICRGKSVQLNAENGEQYEWTPVDFIDNATLHNPTVSPQLTTRYFVKVTNSYGCINKDSTDVAVAAPFKINVSKDTFVCAGSTVALRASGAYSYKWISNTTELSDPQASNPNANPQADASYTVVGYDAYNCFTDTAIVKVGIKPLPTINAGPDLVLPVGSTANLIAKASSNTTQVIWSPADYLSCTNCFATITEPRKPITYIATAKTQFGCIAKDSLFIDLRCVGNTISMPTAFTPDKDGKNDVFYPLGKGIRNIRHFIIFNRWGVTIFEKANISINDRSTGWNGMYKGDLCPQGTYVYAIEVECDTGEIYTYKGTVTLIR